MLEEGFLIISKKFHQMQIMVIVWAHRILAYKKILRPSQWVPTRLFPYEMNHCVMLFLNSKSWYSVFLAPWKFYPSDHQGRVAQSVTCLATDACLTADPGVASLIPVQSYTFVEINHEMISTVILLPSADSFKKGCCQL